MTNTAFTNLPYCTRCGGEVLVTDRYCPSWGQNVDQSVGRLAAPAPPFPSPQMAARAPPSGSKSPGAAAVLNFFFPGLGYIYVGKAGELIFGGLVFVFYFIGFEVGYLIVLLTYVPSTAPVNFSPYTALILLAFLLPFAFAYDGYRRAKSL